MPDTLHDWRPYPTATAAVALRYRCAHCHTVRAWRGTAYLYAWTCGRVVWSSYQEPLCPPPRDVTRPFRPSSPVPVHGTPLNDQQ